MTTPVIGEIRLFAGPFVPEGWKACDGQRLSIQGNEVLFSLIGVAYGGDGISYFCVPDLRGRLPLSLGQGPGLSPRSLAQMGGTETVTLTVDTLPEHDHPIWSSETLGTLTSPEGHLPGSSSYPAYAAPDPGTQVSLADGTTMTGGGQSHENRMPSMAMTYIIAVLGAYPDRE